MDIYLLMLNSLPCDVSARAWCRCLIIFELRAFKSRAAERILVFYRAENLVVDRGYVTPPFILIQIWLDHFNRYCFLIPSIQPIVILVDDLIEHIIQSMSFMGNMFGYGRVAFS